MSRFRFTIRQTLIAIALVAVLALFGRYAWRYNMVAVAGLAVLLGAGLLAITFSLVYGIFCGLGAAYGQSSDEQGA